jgi:exosortase/archaeosortase family protein
MKTIKQLLNDKRLLPLKNVTLFAILILSFHYFFRWWARGGNAYWPIAGEINILYEWLSDLLYVNSKWVLEYLSTLPFTFDDAKREFYINDGYVGVSHGCSGLKPLLQWIVLMTFFPGTWKKKLWFIPVGLVVVHMVNIFRITSLVAILYFGATQQQWDFAHDWILRPFFYVVMFAMWVLWVDKITAKK